MVALLTRYLSLLTHRRREILLVMLVATLALGSGVTAIEGGLAIAQFDVDSEATADLEYVDEHFVTDSGTVSLVVVRDDNVLSRESFAETLDFQEELRENETVGPTLDTDRPTVDSATVFVETELRSLGVFGTLTLEDKQRTFSTISAADIEERLPETLADDQPILGPGTSPSTLLPTDHDGSAQADARLLLVVHDDTAGDLLDAQLAIETLAAEHLEAETFVFGDALVEQRASDATGTAFAALGPLALVLVVFLLLVAYRDLLDVALGLFGIAVVLVWTAGFVGWSGIALTQLLVAVPWLLLGLAIDYGLHVVMRYREAWADGEHRPTRAMTVGLGGVLIAIGVTTVTTAGGFLSGAFGPVAIREFGIVAAFGIVSAFLVFGAFVPALKLELTERLDRDGTRKPVSHLRAVERVVNLGVVGARRAPAVIIVVALLVAVGGAYGATQVDTSTDRTDFLPGESPAWVSSVPGIDADEDRETLQEQAKFLDDRFEVAGGDQQVAFLIRGAVSNESGVSAIHTIEKHAHETDAIRASEGDDAVFTPFDVVERFAEFDDRIADAMADADTTGDGRPDGDVTAAFDATYEIAEEAMNAVVSRENGEYRAVRVVVAVESGADVQTTAAEMRAIAERADEGSGVSVTVTGGPVITADTQSALLRTLVESFVITLAVTFTLLVALFWYRYRRVRLGLVTVVPVVFALTWVLGTMYLVGIPYNAETAIITGIAIGLGVDYAIHVSTRFAQEYEGAGASEHDSDDITVDALSRAVDDTGGTLFASVATTVAALGVLLFTFVPSLQRFGVVMMLAVLYAFLASVFVLPSLLVLVSRRDERHRRS